MTAEDDGETGTKDRARPHTVKKWRLLAGAVTRWGRDTQRASRARGPRLRTPQAMAHEGMARTSSSVWPQNGDVNKYMQAAVSCHHAHATEYTVQSILCGWGTAKLIVK